MKSRIPTTIWCNWRSARRYAHIKIEQDVYSRLQVWAVAEGNMTGSGKENNNCCSSAPRDRMRVAYRRARFESR